MYLKSIEIHGFKSFANKIRLEFHNGITGIVGPNGSGKSNIADAVRWVLGEQSSKQLRGSSMQDVIFAGTELRRPQGFASVAITLDNSDHRLPVSYTQVTVTRRLYRSGESEYLLNGAPCRLRDINEMFYDTGIGKEGYSIIGQGQIDRILSDKPEDRRALFDEAAGIVKFKRRKDVTLKKLASEQENLTRISDILSELEKQVGPLKQQSETARQYLQLKDRLKSLDVNLFLLDHERHSRALEQAREKFSVADAQLSESRAGFERLRTENEELESALAALEQEMEQIRQAAGDAGVQRSRIEGDIRVCQEQIAAGERQKKESLERQQSLQLSLSERKEQRTKIQQSRQEVDDQISAVQEKLDAAQKNLDVILSTEQSLSAQIEELRAQRLQVVNDRVAIRSRMASIETMTRQNDQHRAELTARQESAVSDEDEQKERIAALQKEFQDITDSIAGLQRTQKENEAKIAACRDQLTACDEQLRGEQLAFHQARSRLEALENITQRYEGFGGAVRRVMEQRGREKGILGVVADLLKTEPGYEQAIEIALGGSIQNIVTEDEATAKRLIALLKRERGGRATFLPLTSMHPSGPFRFPKALSEPGAIGTADTLVSCEERYQTLASSLLGRTLIVDSYDHAVAIGRKYSHQIRMVTVDGELFAPGGAISGGAYKSKSNLLGRRREMDQLRAQVQQHREAQERIQAQIEEIRKKRSQMRSDLEQSRRALQEQFLAQNTARLAVIAQQEKQQEAQGSLQELEREAALTRQKTEQLRDDAAKAQRELEQSKAQEKALGTSEQEKRQEADALRDQETAAQKEVSSWEVEVSKVSQNRGFGEENLTRLEREIARDEEELSAVQGAIDAVAAARTQSEQRIADLQQKVQEQERAEAKGSEQLQACAQKKKELTRRQKENITHREDLQEEIAGLDKEVYRLTTQRERLQDAIDSRVNYIWDEYELTPSEAAKLRADDLPPAPELKKQVASIRGEIKSLGPVNIRAIDEYKEVAGRYEFLAGQHDDLVQGAKELSGIVDNLDEQMRKQFSEQFSRIQAEFDQVFQEMFGGGHGRLELMEDQDILEAGVKVIAQPPGKKLQNMLQLSGGEKALTAIALLFAIQNLKPSPFCLLDEIEAALDESNVDRFAQYLHKLTEHTQFIVITHRRGTMEEADRLYGITMQEKGVSTLVSVDLIDQDDLD